MCPPAGFEPGFSFTGEKHVDRSARLRRAVQSIAAERRRLINQNRTKKETKYKWETEN